MSDQIFHCYNLRKLHGEMVVCDKKIATAKLTGDNWIVLYCPRCHQPLRFPRLDAVAHVVGVKS